MKNGKRVTCDELAMDEWISIRFEHHCYFYPGRDCPGWERGKPCGRIGDTIPFATSEDTD